MKTSCGALFYSFNTDGDIGVILGLEYYDWLPFKGCVEAGETPEQAAIREVHEETCGLVCLETIDLNHKFMSKRKHYHIGLCFVPCDIIDKFSELVKDENRKAFKEKKELKFFPLNDILSNDTIHCISKASIAYYWDQLQLLAEANGKPCKLPNVNVERLRKQAMCYDYANKKYQTEEKRKRKKSPKPLVDHSEYIMNWRAVDIRD
jgi:8-oxo-dGTP pyrophosphatase MutT (NUDIX family)